MRDGTGHTVDPDRAGGTVIVGAQQRTPRLARNRSVRPVARKPRYCVVSVSVVVLVSVFVAGSSIVVPVVPGLVSRSVPNIT